MKASGLLSFAEKVDYAYYRLCEPLLKKYDLSQVSFTILMFLSENPEYRTAQEISELRHIKKNLVSVHVEKLVASGYLKRSPVEGDRRKIGLSCTEKAKPILDEGFRIQKDFLERVTKRITEEEWKVHKDIVETITENLNEMCGSEK